MDSGFKGTAIFVINGGRRRRRPFVRFRDNPAVRCTALAEAYAPLAGLPLLDHAVATLIAIAAFA
jgi:hypothetical protein